MPTAGSYASSPPIAPPGTQIPEQDQSAVESARDMMFLDTAVDQFLTYAGQNFGIRRPDASPFDDDMYRKIVQAIALTPKTTLGTLHFLLSAIFGSQESLVTQGLRPWRVYQVIVNEIVIEVPFDLIGTSNDVASYLHGWSGVVLSGATTTVFTTRGDPRSAAGSLVGLGCSAFVSGAWEERTVVFVSYDEATDVATVTTAAFSAPPDAGAAFFINVPGDGVTSFRGDYLSPLWYEVGSATAVAADSLTDSGLSMSVDEHVGRYLRLADGAIHYRIESNTSDTFALAAGGATPPLGAYAVVDSPSDANEESDGAETPPHADRVYLTGDGKIDVVRQYVDELLRAAGVVVRWEKVGGLEEHEGLVTASQAVEFDVAQPLDSSKGKALGQSAETDASQPVVAVKSKTVGQVTETDESQTVTEL